MQTSVVLQFVLHEPSVTGLLTVQHNCDVISQPLPEARQKRPLIYQSSRCRRRMNGVLPRFNVSWCDRDLWHIEASVPGLVPSRFYLILNDSWQHSEFSLASNPLVAPVRAIAYSLLRCVQLTRVHSGVDSCPTHDPQHDPTKCMNCLLEGSFVACCLN